MFDKFIIFTMKSISLRSSKEIVSNSQNFVILSFCYRNNLLVDKQTSLDKISKK